MLPVTSDLRMEIDKLYHRLREWLIEAAYPLWSTQGRDQIHGGFYERLDQHGVPIEAPRRARVQPRQVYAFSLASSFGWRTRSAELMTHGLRYLISHYRRSDGLYRTLVDANGTPLDSRALLYDQAFALLGLASAYGTPGVPIDVDGEARALRAVISKHYRRATNGYETAVPPLASLASNPHMHLLEASLAWMHTGVDIHWSSLADEIVRLALSRFIDPSSGSLREFFDASWQPAPGLAGRIVEPGHQFEWAYLLLRWEAQRFQERATGGRSVADGDGRTVGSAEARRAAIRLIEVGEQYGVNAGVAVNALLDDFSVHDETARLWPQTERLKAAALAARLTDEERYWQMAHSAATTLLEYLDTHMDGLWYDRRLPSGEFLLEPAPASSLYHIVSAIAELRSISTSA